MSSNLEKRVEAIETRNHKVELDKAWETSVTRRSLVLALTYIVMVIFMAFADISRPFISAIIPAIGFWLSTLTVAFIKNWWINKQ